MIVVTDEKKEVYFFWFDPNGKCVKNVEGSIEISHL